MNRYMLASEMSPLSHLYAQAELVEAKGLHRSISNAKVTSKNVAWKSQRKLPETEVIKR